MDLRKEVVYTIAWKILLGILSVIERRILGWKKVEKPKGVQEYDGYFFPSERREKKFSKFELFILEKTQLIRMKVLLKEKGSKKN